MNFKNLIIGGANTLDARKCFHYVDNDVHLYETVFWLIISTVILAKIGLAIVYRSLVLSSRKEVSKFKTFGTVDIGIMMLQFFAVGLVSRNLYLEKSLIHLMNPTNFLLISQIIFHYVNGVLGVILSVIMISFMSCSLFPSLIMVDDLWTNPSDYFVIIVVYILIPLFLERKYNGSLSKLMNIGGAKLLGWWIYIQIRWTIYEV